MRFLVKKRLLLLALVFSTMLACACGNNHKASNLTVDKERIIIGFSQVGAESDWRYANTNSMKEALSLSNGYELIFDDGQQKQSNQITAIRKFIQQEVDYIVLAPVTESGWDTVLQEAKDANIPVILVDRMVDVKDDSLFTCWVGSDFELEAKKVTAWLKQYCDNEEINPEEVHIVNIQGNIGASAQIGRTKGIEDACKEYGWDLVDEVCGDFTQAKGREVMKEFLKQYDNINVVYCENDNEAFGAIEAIEDAGIKVGSDIKNGEIMVLSFDGVNKTALEYVKEGKISCIGECNPDHGPRVRSIIDTLHMGGKPEKLQYVNESLFVSGSNITSLIVDGQVYPITEITDEE